MGRIRQLPPDLVDKIAAGEVVERPASVIKELLENALDAGARRIEVAIEEGGLRLIRVTDDGSGMEADDLPLAVASHATSKIGSIDDLFEVRSLGFRGEALASIAAVSRLRIASRPRPASEAGAGETDASATRRPAVAAALGGHELRVDGGRVGQVVPAGVPVGTSVEVADLFWNVPARRAFLATVRGELRAVLAEARRLALSRPDVSVRVTSDGEVALDAPAADEPRERLAQLLGRELSDDLLALPITKDEVGSLRGYVSPCDRSRGDSQQQFFVLNGRCVRDGALLSAVRQAYANLLPPRRHPSAVLWIDVPPRDVDVNVHPQKSEVRFRRERELFSLIVRAVRAALQQGGLLAELHLPSRRIAHAAQVPGGGGAAWLSPPGASPKGTPGVDAPFRGEAGEPPWSREAGAPPPDAPPAATGEGPALPLTTSGAPTSPLASAASATAPGRFLQVHRRYVVEETPQGVRILDPHALHERILYEDILARLAREPLESQRFLFPQLVDAGPLALAALSGCEDDLRRLGFEVAPFGTNALAVHAAPRLLAPERVSEAVLGLLVDREACDGGEGDGAAPPGLLHELAAALACKSAVRFGDALPDAQVDWLLRRRAEVKNGHCCPHGRPTALALGLDELDRRFGRQG